MDEVSALQMFEYELVTVDKHGKIINQRSHQGQQFIEGLSPGIQLEMVVVPSGGFMMGSHTGSGEPDEEPKHSVWIRRFLLSKYPVSQEQWKAVMDWTPPFRFKGNQRPVDRVSWNGAREFCQRLSEKTGRAYRLPLEAEWEYACRAGTNTAFTFGPTLTTELANYVGTGPYLSEGPGLNRHETTEVGKFPPNAFGLQDMHGNLWEWCADAWHDNYIGAPADSTPWEGNTPALRVLRGGSWHDPPALCRSAFRLFHTPEEGEDIFGFRVALDSLEKAAPRGASNKSHAQFRVISRRIRKWFHS